MGQLQLRSRPRRQAVVVHTLDPGTREPEAGISPSLRLPGVQSKIQTARTTERNPVSGGNTSEWTDRPTDQETLNDPKHIY